MKLIDEISESPLDDSLTITIDLYEIGRPFEDKRDQAKAALAAYGHMLNEHEQRQFKQIANESATKMPTTIDEVVSEMVRMFNEPVPANGRKINCSNGERYAKMLDPDPKYWTEYVELTPEQLAEEEATYGSEAA